MIVFTKVKYQNFLASGNAPIEIELNKHSATLIVGVNGTGKSTLSEAICFALFGRPLRNITKPKLVNSINQSDCLVELEFSVKGANYKVKRGIKPTLFEVYENGKLIPSPASVVDYQTLLEQNIIGLNFKSFMQVVVLGSASYVPFMRLTSSSRREIIEDLLDIEVFGAMNALTKEELNTLKADLDKCAHARELVGDKLRLAQTYTTHLEEQRQQQLDTIDTAITTVEATITQLVDDRAAIDREAATYATVEAAFKIACDKELEYQRLLVTITGKGKKVSKERLFYEEHDTCPTCEQTISDTFKDERYAALTKTEEAAAAALVQCQKLVDKYQTQMATIRIELDQGRELERKAAAIGAQLPVHNARRRELLAQRKQVEAQATQPAEAADVEEIQRQLLELQGKHAELSRKRVIVDAAGMLLRDNGIKAKVIRHYIPIINKAINGYLVAMDFPILFTLDDEFQEKIKSRHRDDFTYDSFSEGEKKRIDLALLLTWRAVARLKNSASTNLLILDEVFDSSLDANGTEEFLKIIAALEADTNIFVISHKTDQLVDKFAHTLVFEKVRGFSQLRP
jgi:DNA repair exonuclease SbcCD ATPase subunit